MYNQALKYNCMYSDPQYRDTQLKDLQREFLRLQYPPNMVKELTRQDKYPEATYCKTNPKQKMTEHHWLSLLAHNWDHSHASLMTVNPFLTRILHFPKDVQFPRVKDCHLLKATLPLLFMHRYSSLQCKHHRSPIHGRLGCALTMGPINGVMLPSKFGDYCKICHHQCICCLMLVAIAAALCAVLVVKHLLPSQNSARQQERVSSS